MLTERIVRDAKSDGATRTVWDTKLPSFGLQVTAGGTKNFVIRYRVDGRRRQAIVARAAELPLKEARERAGPSWRRSGRAKPTRCGAARMRLASRLLPRGSTGSLTSMSLSASASGA